MLKRLLLALLLAFCLSLDLSSEEKYFVTEGQLLEMENLLAQQRQKLKEQLNVIEQQETSIRNLQSSLKETQIYLKESENKNFQNKVLFGIGGFLVGAGAGVLLAYFSN